MKFILHIARLIVGNLFIFSGIVKANDPLGFSYKLHEYFVEFGMDWGWLMDFAMPIAAILCILEIVLGAAVLVGYKMKTVSWTLLAMILFFTVLTGASAIFEIVRSCGCFGDAIPLTPWQSFYKDLVLLVFILLIFFYRNSIKPFEKMQPLLFYAFISALVMGWLSYELTWNFPLILTLGIFTVALILFLFDASKNAVMAVTISLIASTVFSINAVWHLPARDFRPYAVGKNLPEQMTLPENAVQPVYETILTYKNKTTGEVKDFNQDNYPWDDENWEWVNTESVLIKEGDVAKITDLSIVNERGDDITETVLSEDVTFLLIMYDLNKTNTDNMEQIVEFANKSDEMGIPFMGLSAANYELKEEFRHQYQTPFPINTTDGIVLKTIIRSNPGLILLKKGTVIAKWHNNDIPDFQKVNEKYLTK